MKTAFKIADIIVRFIQGEVSEEEVAELDRWLEKSPENRQLFVSLMDERVFEEERNKISEVKLELAFDKVKARKQQLDRRRNLRRWWAAVACVVVLVSVGWFALEIKNTASISLESNEILPVEKQGAYLKLASGQRIELPANATDTLAMQSSTQQIILDYGKIKITSGDTLPAKEEYHVLEVAQGTEYNLILQDGSRIWLNANSKLKFPVRFNGTLRQVELDGEAYFDVARDTVRPFVVHAGNLDVEVLGTEFCIRDYKNKPALATLVEGQVEVRSKNGGWQAILLPGQQAVLSGSESFVQNVETYYYTAWKDGYFAFKDKPVREVMEELAEWYHFHCFFRDQAVAELKITARLKKYDSFDNLLKVLNKMNEIEIEKKGNTITIGSK